MWREGAAGSRRPSAEWLAGTSEKARAPPAAL